MNLRRCLLAAACAAVVLAPAISTGARNDARPVPRGAAPAAASPQDLENAISSACNGLSGTDRHHCVYDVVARNRGKSGIATN